jgi:hypothetical protein
MKHLIRAADIMWRMHKLAYLSMALDILDDGPEAVM